MLKVVSAILGRSINYHIHLIYPHDPREVVPFVIVCDLGAQAAYSDVFF